MSDPGQTLGLEPPTGQRRVRGPTWFLFGAVMVVAILAIFRTCLGG